MVQWVVHLTRALMEDCCGMKGCDVNWQVKVSHGVTFENLSLTTHDTKTTNACSGIKAGDEAERSIFTAICGIMRSEPRGLVPSLKAQSNCLCS